jgi:hypothetical protein
MFTSLHVAMVGYIDHPYRMAAVARDLRLLE